ncbi:MAG: hypothetical protein JRN15_00245 [Nitrososphaerota archaeon]|nr:hypothetical protein [Nitrososphaerota archaeon]
MISFAVTLLGILGATLIPTYVALYLMANLKSVSTRAIGAFGFGLAMWFFFDTFNDSSQLDVNAGFTGGIYHVIIVIVFILGIGVLALFDHFAVPSSSNNANSKPYWKGLVLIPIAIAGIMGIHGMAEGWAFASVGSLASTNSLVDAFGGWLALASYPLHKFFEASIVGAVYTVFVGRNKPEIRAKWHIPLLGILFGIPPAIGASIGYFVTFNVTYFYAFGVTAAFYAILRLVEALSPRFKVGEVVPSYYGPKIFLLLAVGFFCLYFAGLLHG